MLRAAKLPLLLAVVLISGGCATIVPGTHRELQRLKSPDGHSIAILFHKECRGLGLPPEPPATLAQWVRLKIERDAKTIYDSGYESLNAYERGCNALDLIWSPDSAYLAYRHITTIRIIGSDGKVIPHDFTPEGSLVSSFQWIDNNSLLVVAKRPRYPLDISGKPYVYNGYTDQAKDIRITRFSLTKGEIERYRQKLDDPTFLFHSLYFCLDEISPSADRVAFSDGANLCVYDDTVGKLLGKLKIPQKPGPKPQVPANYPPGDARTVMERSLKELASEPAQLEGIWWQTNDKLLLGMAILGFGTKAFYTYDIPTGTMSDVSEHLLPVWDAKRDFSDPDWYRSAMK